MSDVTDTDVKFQKNRVSERRNIVILTGAGISEESGIKTYRDKDGLWQKYDPEQVSSITGWKRNPNKLIEFKDAMRRQLADGMRVHRVAWGTSLLSNPPQYRCDCGFTGQMADCTSHLTEVNAKRIEPNPAHLALTKLQKEWPHGEVTIITQNIDGLHVDAGTEVLQMHGTGRIKKCDSCDFKSAYDADIGLDHVCVNCGDVSTTRPNVVLFGEIPWYLEEIQDKLDHCHIFAAIGTSGNVSPASTFVTLAKQVGAETYLINKEDVVGSGYFDHRLLGKATVIVPGFVDDLLR